MQRKEPNTYTVPTPLIVPNPTNSAIHAMIGLILFLMTTRTLVKSNIFSLWQILTNPTNPRLGVNICTTVVQVPTQLSACSSIYSSKRQALMLLTLSIFFTDCFGRRIIWSFWFDCGWLYFQIIPISAKTLCSTRPTIIFLLLKIAGQIGFVVLWN